MKKTRRGISGFYKSNQSQAFMLVWDFVELVWVAILELGKKKMGLCNAFCSDLLESSYGAVPNFVGQKTSTKSRTREIKHTSLQNALHNPPGVFGGGIKNCSNRDYCKKSTRSHSHFFDRDPILGFRSRKKVENLFDRTYVTWLCFIWKNTWISFGWILIQQKLGTITYNLEFV